MPVPLIHGTSSQGKDGTKGRDEKPPTSDAIHEEVRRVDQGWTFESNGLEILQRTFRGAQVHSPASFSKKQHFVEELEDLVSGGRAGEEKRVCHRL